MAKPTLNDRRARVNLAPVLITPAAAADVLAVSPKTIRRYVTAGRLTGYRIGARALRVDQDEVLALATPIPTATA